MNPHKVVLITGAAKRIGRAIAEVFAEHGWSIALHFHTSESEAQNTLANLPCKHQQIHTMVSADLGVADEVQALYQKVLDQYGRVDAIINNASVFQLDTLETLSLESFDKHMRPNLLAPLLLAQAHLAFCAEQNIFHSCIINILDQKLWNPNPDFLSYTLSKSALEHATILLAQAMAPKVRVVGIAPGMTLPSHLQTTEQFDKSHQLSPLGHASTPQDIAETAYFVCCSKSITGTSILVDGGQHLQKFDRDFSLMNF